jgi:hypothetical protein
MQLQLEIISCSISFPKEREVAKKMQHKPGFLLVGACLVAMVGCKSGMTGTYTDANGAVILELKSGGKANFTFMGDMEDCTYESSGKQLTLTCKGSPAPVTVFNVHDDGSLTGPAGTFMPPLRKEKS